MRYGCHDVELAILLAGQSKLSFGSIKIRRIISREFNPPVQAEAAAELCLMGFAIPRFFRADC